MGTDKRLLPKYEKRELVDAVLYLVKPAVSGGIYRQISRNGKRFRCSIIGLAKRELGKMFNVSLFVKHALQKENPTYALIDSQSVKTVCESENRGVDGSKKRKDESGTRNRHTRLFACDSRSRREYPRYKRRNLHL